MNNGDDMSGFIGEIAPSPPAPSPMGINPQKIHRVVTHPTFFWGKNGDVLFSGWPGTRTGMYVLCLFFVFVVSVLVEMLSRTQLIKTSSNSIVGSILETIIHGIRVALAYIVVLAVMSYNVGIFIVAVAGHSLGFFLFGSRIFRDRSPIYLATIAPDLPPMIC